MANSWEGTWRLITKFLSPPKSSLLASSTTTTVVSNRAQFLNPEEGMMFCLFIKQTVNIVSVQHGGAGFWVITCNWPKNFEICRFYCTTFLDSCLYPSNKEFSFIQNLAFVDGKRSLFINFKIRRYKRWLGCLNGLLPPVFFFSNVVFYNFWCGSNPNFSMDLINDYENFTEEILF